MSLNKIRKLPSKELLSTMLEYRDGKLFWKFISVEEQIKLGLAKRERSAKARNTQYANKEAGHLWTTATSGSQSIQIRILGKAYYAHRVIFKLLKGEEPEIIDHINGNPVDNRIENLRSVDNQTNTRNSKLFSTNTSGHVGVSWDKSIDKWAAYIWNDYKKINLGYFHDIEDAIQARLEAQQEIGFHENHGRSE